MSKNPLPKQESEEGYLKGYAGRIRALPDLGNLLFSVKAAKRFYS